MKLIKKPEVLGIIAKSNTMLYDDIKHGLMTPPVQIGENSVAWPKHECDAINAARISSKSKDFIKQLVKELVVLREQIAGKSEDELRSLVASLINNPKKV